MIEFFGPGAAPFTFALGLVLAIGLLEVLALLVGFSPSGMLDAITPDFDLDVPEASGAELGPLSSVLSWLSVGKVPALALLVILLTSFAISGYVIQLVAQNLLGMPLDGLIASIPALVGGLIGTRYLGRWLGRIFPKDHSEAASQQDLIGSFATIIRGVARKGQPAEAKAQDLRGRTHYLLVEPSEHDEEFQAGARVLITGQNANIYRAVTKLKSLPEDRPDVQ